MSDPKRRGRPPLDGNDRSVNVNFSLPSKQYDELEKQARRERVTLPEIVRRNIQRAKDREDE